MALVQVRMSTQQTAQRLTSIQYGLSNCRESKGTIPPFCIVTNPLKFLSNVPSS